MVRAVEHFRMFLLAREFLLRTDHAALQNLLRRDLPPTTRVERWILRLSEYNFRIEYQKGQDNVIADVLSRLPFATAQAATGIGSSPQDPGVAPRDSSTSVTASTLWPTSVPTSVPPIDSSFMLPDIACRTSFSDSDVALGDADEEDTSDTDSEGDDLQLYCTQDLGSDLDSELRPRYPSDLGAGAVITEHSISLIDLPISRDGL